MVSVLVSKADHYASDEPMIYRFREKHPNLPPMNP
jgi:hypothetical protein